jgi:hypothetical protein
VTDQSQPGEAQPGDSLAQQGGELPRRKPTGESPPPPRGSFWERAEPRSAAADDQPQWRPPAQSESLPQRSSDLPQRSSDLPQRSSDLPQRSSDLPQRSSDLPQRGSDLPQRGSDLPQRGGDLPQRGEPADGTGALPRRTTRTRPSGRHRSPHRLSVASDAPALVLAVPGHADADTNEIGPRVASIAGLSCPGVDIRVGYLEGDDLPVAECLLPAGDEDRFPSVIVPLLLSPNANIDPVLRELAAQPAIPAVLASHLGPHPLVAEALHTRLADAGLARQARSTGLSISADGRGVVVLADIGEEAASAAGVAAVLLASRLSVPVVPASLGDPASIVDAVSRLTDSGAPRPALAPCLIGPETNVSVLDDLSAALGAPCAPTIGAHQAIGQLVAIRYGAALASLSLAG